MPASRRSQASMSLTTKNASDDRSFLRQAEGRESTEVRQVVHTLLEKKRENEPDPVEEIPVETAAEGEAAEGGAARPASGVASITISVMTSSEPRRPPRGDRQRGESGRVPAQARAEKPGSLPDDARSALGRIALRRTAFRSAPCSRRPRPSLRQQLKRLALARKWSELLEMAENAMSLPCSRAWLDLQRLVVAACDALGSDYAPIAAAIRSELCALLNDVPELLDANLLDDTPAANNETRAWLKGLRQPASAAAQPDGADPAADPAAGEPAPTGAASVAPTASRGWPAKAVDGCVLAEQALQAGQFEKAVEIMSQEIARQSSGRGRFLRTMQLVEICVAAGKDSMAQPFLDDVIAAMEAHSLDDWEDKEMVAAALVTVMNVSAKVRDDAGASQQLFERICRLDPVRAASMG